MRREPAAAVLLALGCRSGRATEALGAALAEPIVRLIKLAPLRDCDALALAGGHLDPKTRAAIVKNGGGNPVYTLQLARMSQSPHPTSAGDQVALDADVPALVAAALLAELSSLSASALQLLRAAAVAGDPAEFGLAVAIARMSDDTGYLALDELVDADLLRATERPRTFAFRHPLVRRAVYAGIGDGSRLQAHAVAASALEAIGAAALDRANHIDACAARGDPAAIATLIEAGDASAHTSPIGAARWYAAAERLTPDSDAPERLKAMTRLAGALGSAGEPARSRDVLLQAIDLVAGSDLPLGVQLTAACASCEDFLGQHAVARARLETALQTLPDERSPEAVAVLLSLAAGAWFTTDFERMRTFALRARHAAEPLQDGGLLGSALAVLALANALQGRIDEASASRDAAATLLDGLPDTDFAVHLEAVNHLGWTELYLERFADAITHMTRGVAVARATGQGAFISFMEECQALAETHRGHPEAAHALREDAIDGARLAGVDYVLAIALATAAIGHLVDGDIEAAARDADEALTLTDEGNPFIAGLAGGAGLVAAVTARRSTSIDGRLLKAAGGWEIDALPPGWRVVFHARLTDALIEAGDVDRADRSATAAEAAA
ncbi:MAG TPA: hypothetical protein VGV67_12235, partial [Solirubrobacteraceae bacterium]|nr:hypothetical protein [Solirubrobacteraceae bacterium]